MTQLKTFKGKHSPEIRVVLACRESVGFRGEAVNKTRNEAMLGNMGEYAQVVAGLTWSSSETLNRHRAAVDPFGQLGRGHLAGRARLSGLHHTRLWEGGVHGANRHPEAIT